MPSLSIKSAVIITHGEKGTRETEISGDLELTTAPLGKELGQLFLVATESGSIYPLTSVKLMKR